MSKSAPKHFFSKNPSVNTSRTLFNMDKTDTVTINPDYYYPNYKLLIIPGDTVSLDYSNFVRLLDPLTVPMMDNLYLDTHWWFVPFDICWDYTKQLFGEKRRPSEPAVNTLPQIEFTSSKLPQLGSVYDYFGIPIVGDDNLLSGAFNVQAMPLLAYYLIHDEWIRDEQRVDYLLDTPDFTKTVFSPDDFQLYKRGKRFDYFTSTLLEPQIGNPVSLSLANTAPVYGSGRAIAFTESDTSNITYSLDGKAQNSSPYTPNFKYNNNNYVLDNNTGLIGIPMGITNSNSNHPTFGYPMGIITKEQSINNSMSTSYKLDSGLYADLSTASPVSVEEMRRAFQMQAFNELRARGGTRYTEYLYTIYSTLNPDESLYRPEFLGSTHQRLSVQPITQTSETADTPQGNLAAIVTGGTSDSVFTKSFTKFGYIIGCINIYADLTYFQGLERDWSLLDMYDFPIPMFANLTDQPVYKKELVLTGTSTDDETFGYQEIYSWAKFAQNSLRGLVRPNAPQSLGYWSLAQKFLSVPVNDDTFITSDTDINRIVNDNQEAPTTQHFIVNQKFNVKLTRELPMHSDTMKWFMRA